MNFLIIILFMALKVFTIDYTNREGQHINIQIQDLQDYDPYAVDGYSVFLTGGASPLVIEAFDNGGDTIFGTGIIGKRATLSFKSTAQYGISTFSKGDDKRWYVRAVNMTSGKGIFFGYLLMDDNREMYVPPGTDVFLTATDGLGTLDGVELTDHDGNRIDPDIPLKRIQYLSYILNKTGLQFMINVADNLFNEGMQLRHVDSKNSPWTQSWLLPKTFEKDVNEYVDCKTALEILLNKVARIYMHEDEWWVVRESEKKLFPNNSLHYTKFGWDASVVSGHVGDDEHIITIGHKDDVNIYPLGAAPVTNYFINRGSEVTMKRPCKSTRTEYLFEIPKEIPRNKDFIRGDFNAALSSPLFVAYDIADWTLKSNPAGPSCNVYIRRIFENGYEKERFLVFNEWTSIRSNYAECNMKIYMSEKDKFSFSVDRKLNLEGGSRVFTDVVARIKLFADDGSFYTLDGGTNGSKPYWGLNNNGLLIQIQGDSGNDDLTEWATKSCEAAPLPKSGYIKIELYQSGIWGGLRETHFQNLQFEYIPFINGSYKKYDGEKITNTQPGKLSFKPEHELEVCESPKILFKGALLNYNAGTDVITLLSNQWQDWAVQHAGIGYSPYPVYDKYLKWASLDHYNHYRKDRRKFYVELRWLLHVFGHCDMHNLYLNAVESEHNKNKAFVLLSMTQDWMECVMTGVMVEVDDNEDRFATVESFVSEHRYIE